MNCDSKNPGQGTKHWVWLRPLTSYFNLASSLTFPDLNFLIYKIKSLNQVWNARLILLFASLWAYYQEYSLRRNQPETTFPEYFFSSKGKWRNGQFFRVCLALALCISWGRRCFSMASVLCGTKTPSGDPLPSKAPGKLLSEGTVSESCT